MYNVRALSLNVSQELDPEKPMSLNQGYLYVILSRVTNINNPYLIGEDNVDAATNIITSENKVRLTLVAL